MLHRNETFRLALWLPDLKFLGDTEWLLWQRPLQGNGQARTWYSIQFPIWKLRHESTPSQLSSRLHSLVAVESEFTMKVEITLNHSCRKNMKSSIHYYWVVNTSSYSGGPRFKYPSGSQPSWQILFTDFRSSQIPLTAILRKDCTRLGGL
jgi:hypothetical protein